MSELGNYVLAHIVRGSCQCGHCADAAPHPEQHQPTGHTADLVFFKVAARSEPSATAFLALAKAEFPHWLDGKEHNYLKCGADIGDQGVALMAMGLGKLLGVWELLTPESIMPFLPQEMKMEMAGSGMITIKRNKEEE